MISVFGFAAYTIAKYGMSMCVLGMAEELKPDGIAVNALWPRTGSTHGFACSSLIKPSCLSYYNCIFCSLIKLLFVIL